MMHWARADFCLMLYFVGSISIHFRHLTGKSKELEETGAIVKNQINIKWPYNLRLVS